MGIKKGGKKKKGKVPREKVDLFHARRLWKQERHPLKSTEEVKPLKFGLYENLTDWKPTIIILSSDRRGKKKNGRPTRLKITKKARRLQHFAVAEQRVRSEREERS